MASCLLLLRHVDGIDACLMRHYDDDSHSLTMLFLFVNWNKILLTKLMILEGAEVVKGWWFGNLCAIIWSICSRGMLELLRASICQLLQFLEFLYWSSFLSLIFHVKTLYWCSLQFTGSIHIGRYFEIWAYAGSHNREYVSCEHAY